jgi:hypothetical protein
MALLCISGCGRGTPGAGEHPPDSSEQPPPPDSSGQPGLDAASDIPRTGLHLWLRADTGLSFSSGTQVSQWLDQSGNGRNASMTTTARQPFLVLDALNHLPVIRFSGAQSMYLDTFATPTMFSVFVVGRNSMPNASFSMILGPGGNSPNNQLRWEDDTHTLFVWFGSSEPSTTIGDTRIYHALSTRYDGAVFTVYRDGTLASSSSFTTSGPWTIASVGSWYSSYFMIGDLAEVIIFDRALSTPERTSVDSYLRSKYNLP